MSHIRVTINSETLETLHQLAEGSGEPVEAVLDHAVEAYRRRDFLVGLNNDFEALKRDPSAWEEELRERKEWEATPYGRSDRAVMAVSLHSGGST